MGEKLSPEHKFIQYAVTVRKKNTVEWLKEFEVRFNKFADEIKLNQKLRFNGDWFVIENINQHNGGE